MNRHDETPDMYASWAKAIRDSDDTAFDQLFRALYEPLVRFAMKYTNSKATACDITQEVFIRLWQQRDSLDPSQSIRSWLYTSVRNQCLNHIRDHRNESIGLVVEPEDERPSGESESDSGSTRKLQRLQEWVHQLPDRQREAFTLSRYEGLDHEEIAHVMKVSVRTVNNHLVRALHSLRERGRTDTTSLGSVHHG